jgi:hypothetical protein
MILWVLVTISQCKCLICMVELSWIVVSTKSKLAMYGCGGKDSGHSSGHGCFGGHGRFSTLVAAVVLVDVETAAVQ